MMRTRLLYTVMLVLVYSSSCSLGEAQQTGIQVGVSSNACVKDADCPLWTGCNISTRSCVCKDEFSDHDSTVVCNKETLQLSVFIGHCVTFDPEKNRLFEGRCLENSGLHNTVLKHIPLPVNVSELDYFMCEERFKRTGRLCGKCLSGYSPLAYSYDIRCVKCPEGNKNIWKYILVAFGPLTIFYFLVVFLKISALSSCLHGFVIYSQIISSPHVARKIHMELVESELLYPHVVGVVKASGVLYGIWNLDFFRALDLGICLDVSSLTVLALDYAVAFYPLLLTAISYFLIELHARNFKIVVIVFKPFYHILTLFRRNWDSKTTVIDAYATFFVLSYVKVLWISADLLTPVRVHSIGNSSNSEVVWALFYDATVGYFDREHLSCAVLALTCVMVVMVQTLFLCFYQCSCFQKIITCMKLRSHVLLAFTDSFQSCFKDGTEPGTRDYRWFAAVPLLARVVLLLACVIVPDINLQIVIITGIVVLTAVLQPYKIHSLKLANLDVTFWGFLVITFSIESSYLFSSYKPVAFVEVVGVLRVIASLIPLLYMFLFASYLVLSGMKKMKLFISQLRAWRRGYLNIENDFVEGLPDRVMNPEQYCQEHLENPIT